MSKKKTIYLPLYDEFEDTPWISRNRELNTQAYDLYSQGLGDLGKQDQQYYEGQASKAMQSAWGDYNRNYQKAVNQNLARNYGRTGSTASTSGGYVTDSLQRQYNDAAARLASQQAQLQDQFINSALQRDLAKLGQYSNAFNTSGQTTQEVDKFNYDIRQQNKDRQWQNDVLREKSKTDWVKIALDAAQGGFTGMYGYADDFYSRFNSGSSGGGIGSTLGGLFGGSNTKKLGSNIGSSAANTSGRFNPTFSGYTSLFGG